MDVALSMSGFNFSGKDSFFLGLGGTDGGIFFISAALAGVAGCLILFSIDPVEVLGVKGGDDEFFRIGLGDFSASFTGCLGNLCVGLAFPSSTDPIEVLGLTDFEFDEENFSHIGAEVTFFAAVEVNSDEVLATDFENDGAEDLRVDFDSVVTLDLIEEIVVLADTDLVGVTLFSANEVVELLVTTALELLETLVATGLIVPVEDFYTNTNVL